MTYVHEWYESNKLVINKYKSSVMLLTTRQMLSHMTHTDLNVCIGNYELPQCNNIKYLGVDITGSFLTKSIFPLDIRGIDLVKTLGLMNISQRRDYFMIILMFKSIHGLVPN